VLLVREVKLAPFLEARAGVALTQDLEGRPILGELLRDTALGRDDGLREMLGRVLRGGRHLVRFDPNDEVSVVKKSSKSEPKGFDDDTQKTLVKGFSGLRFVKNPRKSPGRKVGLSHVQIAWIQVQYSVRG
jgi:hypothetical protein